MPAKRLWTVAEDAMIMAGDRSYTTLANLFGVSRWTVRERARVLGCPRGDVEPAPPSLDDADRPPYPAGHPVTWGLITAGTCLEGVEWPG
jgi:hypothetical protein